MSESLVNVKQCAGRGDGPRPVDRHVTNDGHSQIGMSFEAERQNGDADEEDRHQADDLYMTIERNCAFNGSTRSLKHVQLYMPMAE